MSSDVGILYFNESGAAGRLTNEQATYALTGAQQNEEIVLDDMRTKELFKKFITTFKEGQLFPYRDQLRRRVLLEQYFINVQLEHLADFNPELFSQFKSDPAKYLPVFEEAAKEVVPTIKFTNQNVLQQEDIPGIQICLQWSAKPTPLRELNAKHVSKLVCISGIVINCSRTSPKATKAFIQCTHCKLEKQVTVRPGFSAISLPKRCESVPVDGSPCPPDSYIVLPDKCSFVDQQTMKLQEAPESVPTGEMPRHIVLTGERYLVEKAAPGTRVNLVGIYSTFNSGKSARGQSIAIRYPYLRVLGISINIHGTGRTDLTFTQAEEEKFIQFSKTRNLYETIAKNIDPAIYGHEDIKKSITCQLFGGASKHLPDGIRRRGDINVLLLGDPSTAKSQLLKFVEKVAPIGVYTSGKGSSAAGLTACINKEPGSGEFYLEGGSMVLADGGIVCIDEFDKMRQQDRVAIHEAMEQQTISIAKAGITTVLNSRTSVLAAANPIFGRYDDMKTAEEQIDFQTTILSRFDMIFIVRDVRDAKRDEMLAKHVISIHIHRKAQEATHSDLDIDFLKRYIAYCRSRCSPRLNKPASDLLGNYYVNQRSSSNNKNGTSKKVIPITVRQLEALVRISESLARMTLLPEATEQHAQEAIRLFTASTVDAINSGVISELSMSSELSQEVQKVEHAIQKKLSIGGMINQEALVSVLERNGFQRYLIERAIFIMVQRNEIEYRQQRKSIYRKK